MHQRNVQQWASTLRQSHRNHLQPPNVNDVNVGSENVLRNVSATIKTRENNDNRRYSLTLNFKPPKKDFNRSLKPQFYTFDMTTKDEQKLHSPSDVQLCDNHTLDLLTPSSDHHDIDALSDAGTYIIEDDVDMAQNNNSEPKMNSSSLHRRYVNQTRNRHGTFDIHGFKPATEHTIHRPLVDLNMPAHDLSSSSSSSSSSLVSPLVENDFSILNSFTHAPTTLLQQQSTIPPPKNQIKPAECFDISPAFETKLFPATNISRRKAEPPWKSKLPTRSVPITDVNLEIPTSQSSSPPLSARSNQGITEKYYTQPGKKPSSAKTSINNQPHSTSSFVRNSPIRQTVPANAQYQRPTISSAIINNNEATSNLTKVYANKSFILRQQRSNLLPSTPKMIEQQQTISKHTSSILSPITNSSGQTNRAVELRRANAQAKIEELSQRTKKHLHKTNQQSDIMSVSWHSNASSTSKTNLRSDPRTTRSNIAPERQDMLATRTISSSSNNRSTSASPNRLDETSSRYQKAMISSFTDSQQSQRLTASTSSVGGERCDSLRDNGQRLAIKLIQLSSSILEKLKSNDTTTDDDTSLRELEQLVDKLQTVKRTLTTIDALLTGPTNDNGSI